MEAKNEKQQRALQLLNLARLAGVAKTQKEFADFLGINENTLGRALMGQEKYLTDNFFARIENAFNESGINLDGANVFAPVNNQHGENTNQQPAVPPVDETPTTARLLDELKAQREMYDRQFTELLKQNSQLINIITLQSK